MAGGAEGHPLDGVRRIGPEVVVGADEGIDVDEVGGLGRLARAGVLAHG